MSVSVPPPVSPPSKIVDQPAVNVGLAGWLSASKVYAASVVSFVVGVAPRVCVSAPSAISVVFEVVNPAIGVVVSYPVTWYTYTV